MNPRRIALDPDRPLCSEWFLTTSPLMFRTRSVMSSTIPGIEENS